MKKQVTIACFKNENIVSNAGSWAGTAYMAEQEYIARMMRAREWVDFAIARRNEAHREVLRKNDVFTRHALTYRSERLVKAMECLEECERDLDKFARWQETIEYDAQHPEEVVARDLAYLQETERAKQERIDRDGRLELEREERKKQEELSGVGEVMNKLFE